MVDPTTLAVRCEAEMHRLEQLILDLTHEGRFEAACIQEVRLKLATDCAAMAERQAAALALCDQVKASGEYGDASPACVARGIQKLLTGAKETK